MPRGDGKAGLRREVVSNLTRSVKLSEQSINLQGVAQEMCRTFELNFDDLHAKAVEAHEKAQAKAAEAAAA